jgi:hypothetical protein
MFQETLKQSSTVKKKTLFHVLLILKILVKHGSMVSSEIETDNNNSTS